MMQTTRDAILEAIGEKPTETEMNQLSLFDDDELPPAEPQPAQPQPEPEKKPRKRSTPASKNYTPEEVVDEACKAFQRRGISSTIVDDLMYVYASFTGHMYPNPLKNKTLNTSFVLALDKYRTMK